jgi:hypothetical protein
MAQSEGATIRYDVEASQKRLVRNERDFRNLLGNAEREFSRGRLNGSAAWAQVAAEHAWLNPNGRFVSSELEFLLTTISESVRERPMRRPATRRGEGVLHVITQVYQTGGPTQFVTSWLDQDHRRKHHVALTRQGLVPVPVKLASRIGAGVPLSRIDEVPGGLLGRAGALRHEARGFGTVLVHSHPYDVVPILAFGAMGDAPPIVYVNHADHVFWAGVSIARTLLSMRASGAHLAIARRGVDPARSVITARPLRLRGRTLSRENAKRQLGLDPDKVLVVTAADGPKYESIGGPSLLDMVLPVFEERPNAIFLAAGPSDAGEWSLARHRTGNQVRALGALPDVSVLQQAADIYLDSFPFSSLTSLLEAGSFGTAVMTYAGHPAEGAVLGADTPGVDDWISRPISPGMLRLSLLELVDHADLRVGLGESVQRSIISTHTGDGWLEQVQVLMDQAAANTSQPSIGTAMRGIGIVEQLVEMVMARTPFSRGVPGAILDNFALLPLPSQVRLAVELSRQGAVPQPRYLIPEPARPSIARARQFFQRRSSNRA